MASGRQRKAKHAKNGKRYDINAIETEMKKEGAGLFLFTSDGALPYLVRNQGGKVKKSRCYDLLNQIAGFFLMIRNWYRQSVIYYRVSCYIYHRPLQPLCHNISSKKVTTQNCIVTCPLLPN